jgi:hypothetical protein
MTDFGAIERAEVPILRSLNIQYRLKQQVRKQGILPGYCPSLTLFEVAQFRI